jgi:hypothetical protein
MCLFSISLSPNLVKSRTVSLTAHFYNFSIYLSTYLSWRLFSCLCTCFSLSTVLVSLPLYLSICLSCLSVPWPIYRVLICLPVSLPVFLTPGLFVCRFNYIYCISKILFNYFPLSVYLPIFLSMRIFTSPLIWLPVALSPTRCMFTCLRSSLLAPTLFTFLLNRLLCPNLLAVYLSSYLFTFF